MSSPTISDPPSLCPVEGSRSENVSEILEGTKFFAIFYKIPLGGGGNTGDKLELVFGSTGHLPEVPRSGNFDMGCERPPTRRNTLLTGR